MTAPDPSDNNSADNLFLKHLLDHDAAIWVAQPGRGAEYTRPDAWQNITADGNEERLKAFREGRDAIAMNTGMPFGLVDCDPRNGGDIAKTRKLLADLKVVILAELNTPGNGKHWHVPGHRDLPTTHFNDKNQPPDGYRGVDIQSHGANVFLPGTLRPKYNGRGYTIVFDDLYRYDPDDAAQKAGAEALTDWVVNQRIKAVKSKGRKGFADWKLSPPWNRTPPDKRQRKYLDKALAGEAAEVQNALPGSRNETLFIAALKLGSYIAGAGLDEQKVIAALEAADYRGDPDDWSGIAATRTTIRSGLYGGKQNPRAVPDKKQNPQSSGRSFIDPDEGLLALQLAEAVMASVACGFGRPDRQFYVYDNGVWQPDEDAIRAEITRLLGDRHRNSHIKPVLDHIQYSPGTPTLTDGPLHEFINVPNGMLDWKAGTLLPHSPDYRSTVQLPVEWNPNATCPDFEVFIAEVLPPDLYLPTADSKGFIWELIGYTMFSGNPIQVAILLFGNGRNGKGTLIRVIQALLGDRNCSNVGLHELVENRFRAATLFRKLANLAGDLDSKWLDNTAVFKAITGNDGIQAEHKYGAAFNFTPWALPFYSINKAFGSADSSEGWLARWVIVPFPHTFLGHEDRGLDAKLQTPAELQGIMRRGVEALPGLIARGRFAKTKSLVDAKAAFIVASDAVRAHVDEHCVVEVGAWIKRRELYDHYSMHANTDGGKKLSSREFYNRIRQISGVQDARRQGVDGFDGIRIKW